MTESKSLLESIQLRLQGIVRLPHQASAIGYDLFLLIFKFGLSADSRVHELSSIFISSLKSWGLDDLLVCQVNYAIKLASTDGKLEYEEMHKLFSLCDEIYALEIIGLAIDSQLKKEYEKVVKDRFYQESGKAKMVAEDKVEEWQKEFWWYKHNLA